jgi:hypothetical protein
MEAFFVICLLRLISWKAIDRENCCHLIASRVMKSTAFRHITDESAKLSLKVQPKRSQFIYFSDNMPLSQPVIDQLAALDIRIYFDSTTVLGCPIAKDDTVLHRSSRSTVESLIESIKVCMQEGHVSSQSTILILRSSFPQDRLPDALTW